MSNVCVILGTSNPCGTTFNAVQEVFVPCPPIYNLSCYTISPYDYTGANQNDDFLPLMKELLLYPCWVFATPVYWYTMSAQMKIFFDRFTDLLMRHKEICAGLKGKSVFLLCTSGDKKPEEFESPFEKTCAYLGMHYEGCCAMIDPKNPKSTLHNPPEIEKAKAWFRKKITT